MERDKLKEVSCKEIGRRDNESIGYEPRRQVIELLKSKAIFVQPKTIRLQPFISIALSHVKLPGNTVRVFEGNISLIERFIHLRACILNTCFGQCFRHSL